MEELLITNILKPLYGEKDEYNVISNYSNTRNKQHFYSGEEKENQNHFEIEVFNFMIEKFHPTLFEIMSNANWDRFYSFQGNICGQVAGYGGFILSKLFNDWDYQVVRFIEGGWNNHTVLLAGPPGQKRIIDLDRKNLESLWWNIGADTIKYPNISGYFSLNIGEVQYYNLPDYESQILTKDKFMDPTEVKIALGKALSSEIANLVNRKS